MPIAPRKSCSCRGCSSCQGRCPELTTGGKCRACKSTTNRGYRNPTHTAVYNSPRWQALRRQVLREQPWCAEPGCTQPSHDVHHIVELADDIRLAYVRTNVEGRCHAHHSSETAKAKFHRD